MLHKTAIVLLVNEDLKQCHDHGSMKYVTEQLSNLHYTVIKTTMVSHMEAIIASELEESIKRSDIVILIGGIGSHYSNSILRVVSKVFNQNLEYNKKLSYEGADGKIPTHAKLLECGNDIAIYIQGLLLITDKIDFVITSFRNIIAPFLKNFNKVAKLKRILIGKSDICGNLIENAQCKESVELGYEMNANSCMVTLTSSSMTSLLNCEESIKATHGDKIIKSLIDPSIERAVYDLNNAYSHVKSAIECIAACLTKYGPDNVFLSFNGGKDCTVLLHLTLGVLRRNYPDYDGKLFCVYVESPHPFVELNNFIALCERYYNLNIIKLSKSIKESLEIVLRNAPYMKACLMGTRRTDPFSENLQSFQVGVAMVKFRRNHSNTNRQPGNLRVN